MYIPVSPQNIHRGTWVRIISESLPHVTSDRTTDRALVRSFYKIYFIVWTALLKITHTQETKI